MSFRKIMKRRIGARPASMRSRGKPGAGTRRRLHFEPLEDRMLLSVGAGLDQNAFDAEPVAGEQAPAVLAADEQVQVGYLEDNIDIGVWTEQVITNLPQWLASQDWPQWMDAPPLDEASYPFPGGPGPQGPVGFMEGFHMQLTQDPRGGYRTILRIAEGTYAVSADQALADLEQLDFVDYAKLASLSLDAFGPATQELIDAMTNTGVADETMGHIFDDANRPEPITMRVALRTEDRIEDIESFVESQRWAETPERVTIENVRQLLSIPMRSSNSGGGYRTIVTMDVFGDVTAIEEADFVDYAKLESESVIQFGAGAQESIDAMTRTGKRGETYGHVFLEESAELSGVNAYRDDQRFEGLDGAGFAVAVLDTGIDMDHDFFGNRIVHDWDYVNDDNDADDDNGHGTHVSSIAASEDGTLTGMAPDADIVVLKVADDEGFVDLADVEDALSWIAEHADEFNIVSVNMSLGLGNYNTAVTGSLSNELEFLVDALNIIVVSASGNSFNSYSSAEGVAYPAADANSLAVGAVYDEDLGREPDTGTYTDGSFATTTDDDRVCPYSQRHETLTTILAPGENITAAWLDNDTATLGGTSMAAPHIAGMAVLAKELADEEIGHPLTQAQFAELLQSTGTTVNDGDDENDNVTNTDLDFPRADMFALGDEMLDLLWIVDANDDPAPGDQMDDGNLDTFALSRTGNSFQMTVNGSALPLRAVDSVMWITVNGSTDNDKLYTYALGSSFLGSVIFNGEAGGIDEAFLYDSPGNDTFVAAPLTATLTIPDAYKVRADYCEGVHVYATAGGIDDAILYDSAGDDIMFGSPTVAALYGAGYYNRPTYFEGVKAWATGGGTDVATFYDSTGDDTFYGTPVQAALYGTGYYNQANLFTGVHAHATSAGAGNDVATLYDSAGDDLFFADAASGFLYGTGFFNRAYSFNGVHAHATAGGDDRADFDGSAANDTFFGTPTQSGMYLSGGSWFNRAVSFEEVYGDLGQAGTDIVDLYDSDQDDLLEADDDWAELSNAADDWLFQVAGLDDFVKAYSDAGDDDTETIDWPNLLFTLDLSDWD